MENDLSSRSPGRRQWRNLRQSWKKKHLHVSLSKCAVNCQHWLMLDWKPLFHRMAKSDKIYCCVFLSNELMIFSVPWFMSFIWKKVPKSLCMSEQRVFLLWGICNLKAGVFQIVKADRVLSAELILALWHERGIHILFHQLHALRSCGQFAWLSSRFQLPPSNIYRWTQIVSQAVTVQ